VADGRLSFKARGILAYRGDGGGCHAASHTSRRAHISRICAVSALANLHSAAVHIGGSSLVADTVVGHRL
jgi:hypothetical protein